MCVCVCVFPEHHSNPVGHAKLSYFRLNVGAIDGVRFMVECRDRSTPLHSLCAMVYCPCKSNFIDPLKKKKKEMATANKIAIDVI